MQKYTNIIILTTNFNIIHEINHIKAQHAGLIDLFMLFWCKNSQISAHQKGHISKPNGQKNSHIIIHIKHPRFHRLLHHNFFVHSTGK